MSSIDYVHITVFALLYGSDDSGQLNILSGHRSSVGIGPRNIMKRGSRGAEPPEIGGQPMMCSPQAFGVTAGNVRYLDTS